MQDHIEQEGTMELRIVKCLFFGPPSVGKTTTRKRLTEEIKNLSTSTQPTSTGVDNPLTVNLYHETEHVSVLIPHGGKWEEQTIMSEATLLMSCLHLTGQCKMPSQSSTSNNLEQPTGKEKELSEATDKPKLSVQKPSVFNPQSNPKQEIKPVDEQPSLEPQAARTPEVRKKLELSFFNQLVQERRWKELAEKFQDIKNFTILQMIDIGGQPEFHEILPLLLSGPALYLIFFNLTQEFDTLYEVTYTHEDHSHSSISYRSQFTNKDIVLQILTTIASMNSGATQSSEDSLCHKQSSQALLLGTYKDRSTKEKLANLEHQIRKSEIQNFVEESILHPIPCKGLSEFIFPLDNKNGEREEIVSLRNQLGTHILNNFKPQPLPTSWAFFHLALRNEYENTPEGWCYFDDAIELGLTYGISETKIETVLNYFHCQFGTILFYPEVAGLKNIVVCNPNVIFKPIASLIAFSFGSEKHKNLRAETIRSSGQFSIEFIDKAMSQFHCDSNIRINAVVELMKYRNIICEVRNEEFKQKIVYFMPSLLQPKQDVTVVTKEHLEKWKYSPLLIFAPGGYIPIGLFSTLVVHLAKAFKLKNQSQYKNHISFIEDPNTLCEIELIQRLDVLEVRVDSDNYKEATKACTRAFSLINEFINEMEASHAHILNRHLEYGFYCPQSFQRSDKPHFAKFYGRHKSEKMLCLNAVPCQEKRFELDPIKHKIWFPENEV